MQGLRQQCQISFGLMLSTFLSSIFLSELGLKIHKTKFSEYQDLNLGQLGEEKDVRFGAVLPPKKVNVQKVSFKIMSCFLQVAFTSGEKLEQNRSADLSEKELFEVTLEKCSHGPKRKEITIYEGLEFVKA